MADSSVVFETKVDNKGFQKGLRDAGREITMLTKELDVATNAISEQEKKVASLNTAYGRMVDELDKAIDKKNKLADFSNKEFTEYIAEAEALERLNIELEKAEQNKNDYYKAVKAGKAHYVPDSSDDSKDPVKLYADAWFELETAKANFARHGDKFAAKYKEYAQARDEAQRLADETDRAVENINAEADALGKMRDDSEKLRQHLEDVKNSPVYDFTEQAKIAQEDIAAMEERIKGLYALLDEAKEPAAIVALEHEIAAAEQGLESFRNNLSKPVADLLNLQQVESELKAANDEITRLNSLIANEKSPIGLLRLRIELEKAKNHAGTLTERLNALKSTDVGEPAEDTAKLNSTLQRVNNALMRVSRGFANTFGKLPSALKKGVGVLGKLAKGILTIGRNTKKTNSAVSGLGTHLLSLVKAAFVFNVLRRGLSELQKYLGSLLKTNAEFVSSLNSVKVNLATAFQPILEAIIPALNTLMSALANVTAYIAAFTSMLFGKTYAESKAAAKAINAQAEALENTGSAAKEASGFLASFDKINQAAADTSSGTDGFSANFEDVETPAMDTEWLDTLKTKLLDIVPDISYFSELGTKIAKGVTDALNNIPWDDIQAWAASFAAKLAAFLGGFLANADIWIALGHTLAQGLNTALTFLYTFLTKFPWRQFGEAIAVGINQFFAETDWALLGATLAAWVMMIFDTLYGLFTTLDWELIGKSVGTTINEFFEKLDFVSMAKTVSSGIIGALSTIGSAIRTIDWRKIGEDVKTFLVNIDWNGIAQELFRTIGNAIGGIALFLIGLLGEAWQEVVDWWYEKAYEDGEFTMLGLLKGICEVFKNINRWLYENLYLPFVNGFKEMFGIHSPSTVMAEMGENLIKGLWEGIKNVKQWILDKISGFVDFVLDGVKSFFGIKSPSTLFRDEIGKNIGLGLAEGITETDTEIESALTDTLFGAKGEADGTLLEFEQQGVDIGVHLLDGLKSVFPSIKDAMTDIMKDMQQIVTDITPKIQNAYREMFNGILTQLESFANNYLHSVHTMATQTAMIYSALPDSPLITIPPYIPIQIPRLATGGIVSHGLYELGERGREMVLPLENNTGWMDDLADRFAERMASVSGGSGGDVIIQSDATMGQLIRMLRLELVKENKRAGYRIQSQGAL